MISIRSHQVHSKGNQLPTRSKTTVHLSLLLTLITFAISSPYSSAQSNSERLHAHTREFRKEVITVTDGVHVAIGFALANSIMIEGDSGIIIVDTTENPVAAKEILAEFRKISKKPVVAIVYTHYHADHVMGTEGFIEGSKNVKIIAHELNPTLVAQSYGMLRPITASRGVRQFGVMLPTAIRPNAGIGPMLRIGSVTSDDYIPPTLTIDDKPLELA
ncbi:MAG TPA: MBL fold metallo-hydrolase, partial [Dehalococcoidia bacterium]|nr:MBL fold metallo-hydrolase [Dehalococcoidia bacterium]